MPKHDGSQGTRNDGCGGCADERANPGASTRSGSHVGGTRTGTGGASIPREAFDSNR